MKKNSFWSLLINPFTRIDGWKAFLLGFTILLATTIISYWGNVIPRGLLSVKSAGGANISTILISQLSALAVLVLVVYVTALISTRRVRFQDVLGITTLAQAPVLLIAAMAPMLKGITDSVVNAIKNGEPITPEHLQSMGSYVLTFLIGIVLITTLIWYLVLLYNGFKTLTDIKGTKSVIIFIVIVLLCDFLSTLLFSLLVHGKVNLFTI